MSHGPTQSSVRKNTIEKLNFARAVFFFSSSYFILCEWWFEGIHDSRNRAQANYRKTAELKWNRIREKKNLGFAQKSKLNEEKNSKDHRRMKMNKFRWMMIKEIVWNRTIQEIRNICVIREIWWKWYESRIRAKFPFIQMIKCHPCFCSVQSHFTFVRETHARFIDVLTDIAKASVMDCLCFLRYLRMQSKRMSEEGAGMRVWRSKFMSAHLSIRIKNNKRDFPPFSLTLFSSSLVYVRSFYMYIAKQKHDKFGECRVTARLFLVHVSASHSSHTLKCEVLRGNSAIARESLLQLPWVRSISRILIRSLKWFQRFFFLSARFFLFFRLVLTAPLKKKCDNVSKCIFY